jgi:hypothetical protein
MAALAAGTVFWLADHFGMVAPPYSVKPLDLRPIPTHVDAHRRAIPDSPPATGHSAVSEFFRFQWTIATGLHSRRDR